MQFSLQRFSCLFKLQLATNRRQYLLGTAALAGILLLVMLFFMMDDAGLTYGNQQGIYIVGFLLSAGLFGGTFFKQFSKKSQRIQALMLPVSGLERLAVAVFFVAILYPVYYSLVCVACLRVMNYIDVYWLNHFNAWYYLMNDMSVLVLLAFYFYMQALMLLGAIWFRKQTFVKTAVMVSLIAILLTSLNDFFGQRIIGAVPAATKQEVMQKLSPDAHELTYRGTTPYISTGFSVHSFDEGGQRKGVHYTVTLPAAPRITVYVLLLLAPCFLWYITLVKLREQQL